MMIGPESSNMPGISIRPSEPSIEIWERNGCSMFDVTWAIAPLPNSMIPENVVSMPQLPESCDAPRTRTGSADITNLAAYTA